MLAKDALGAGLMTSPKGLAVVIWYIYLSSARTRLRPGYGESLREVKQQVGSSKNVPNPQHQGAFSLGCVSRSELKRDSQQVSQ